MPSFTNIMSSLFAKNPILLVTLLWVFSTDVFSQEIQLPMDNEGNIESINAQLNAKIGLFTEYAGFKEARLFEVGEKEFIVEISYKPESRILRKRIPYTAEEVQTLRSKVSAALKASPSEMILDQEGRTKLIITSTAAALSYYGWAIPVAFHMQSAKAVASTYMFTSALGFYIPFAVTRNTPVTEAAGNAYFYGTTRGALHGYILHSLVVGNNFSYRRALGFSVAGSIGEAFAFYKFATLQNFSTGKVELLGAGADFGFGIGFAAPFLFNYESSNRLNAWSMLAGTGAGFVAANYLSRREHYTQGDAFVFRGAGTMGAYSAISAANLAKSDNEKIYAGAFIAGSLGGLFLGHQLVREKDFTPAQGTFIELGQLAGWFTGLGIAYLIQNPNSSSDGRLFSTMSAVGGITGYTLMYRTFAGKAQEKAAKSSWDFHVMPQNLLVGKLHKSFGKSIYSLPIATLDVTF
ncbi:hypothetical protein JNM05_12355 [bacterium]|nr:hypothetical protein [bacterium]